MKYNPQIHHRRSIRLKGYDYSQAGAYFVTICAQNRECRFGKIANGEMILNDAGMMINKWWQKIPEKFPDIELDVYQIMPNHFHAIAINNGTGNVRANPRVRPDDNIEGANPRVRPDDNIEGANPRVRPDHKTINITGADPRVHPDVPVEPKNETIDTGQTRGSAPTMANIDSDLALGEHVGSPLHRVIQWFKTMSTNEYIRGVKSLGWAPFNGKLWQRNYYEHIIRNDRSYQNISNYIINNPAKWDEDKFFKN